MRVSEQKRTCASFFSLQFKDGRSVVKPDPKREVRLCNTTLWWLMTSFSGFIPLLLHNAFQMCYCAYISLEQSIYDCCSTLLSPWTVHRCQEVAGICEDPWAIKNIKKTCWLLHGLCLAFLVCTWIKSVAHYTLLTSAQRKKDQESKWPLQPLFIQATQVGTQHY